MQGVMSKKANQALKITRIKTPINCSDSSAKVSPKEKARASVTSAENSDTTRTNAGRTLQSKERQGTKEQEMQLEKGIPKDGTVKEAAKDGVQREQAKEDSKGSNM